MCTAVDSTTCYPSKPFSSTKEEAPKLRAYADSVGLVCVCAVARRGVEVGPRELARNAEPPWPSPARRALLVACLVSLSPRAAPCTRLVRCACHSAVRVRGVGHANGFSFLSARTTPCIDALRACLGWLPPSQPQARVPHGGPSLRPARRAFRRSRLCKLTSGGPTSSRTYCPLRRLTTPALRPFHRYLPHVLPFPSKSTEARPRPP